jgi:hypothetical protein
MDRHNTFVRESQLSNAADIIQVLKLNNVDFSARAALPKFPKEVVGADGKKAYRCPEKGCSKLCKRLQEKGFLSNTTIVYARERSLRFVLVPGRRERVGAGGRETRLV